MRRTGQQNGLIYKGNVMQFLQQYLPICWKELESKDVKEEPRESLYWPKIAMDIEQFISNCEAFNTYANEQAKEPMISHRILNRPWQVIACDLTRTTRLQQTITRISLKWTVYIAKLEVLPQAS